MTSTIVHRSLDGHQFKYGGAFDLDHPATSVANVFVDGILREFTSGPLWAGRTVAEHAHAALDQEFSCQGGMLRLGEAVNRDSAGQVTDRRIIAVWQGQQYNLLSHLYNASVTEAVALMNSFQIIEKQDGIVIAPRPHVQAAFQERAVSAKFVPGLGLIEAKWRGKREVAALPPWPGAEVPSGELFRDTLSNGDTYLVLVTATAVVTILPEPNAQPADVARVAGNLDVQVLN